MKKQILTIPRRRATPVACFIILLLAQNQDLSAQRAKRKDKTRIYTIDLSQSRVTATLTQEGFIARRYPTHRVEVKNFTGKIEVSEKDETPDRRRSRGGNEIAHQRRRGHGRVRAQRVS